MTPFPRANLLSDDMIFELSRVATAIRCLSVDMVQNANSGHPGLPLGCAEIGAYLFGLFLRFNPKDPDWEGRDRFILSAGHGSAFLYSCLYLSGFDLSIDDLREFRRLNSKTPGHPERGVTAGVESTTGPLGQGLGHAVGQALSLKMFYSSGKEEGRPSQPKVIALCGDGCLMEGISYEVSSFAGHLKLDNLIVVFDSNGICLDGFTKDCWTDDITLRFKSCGWDIVEIDGHDLQELHKAFYSLREQQTVPTLIVARTIIGKGSPVNSGTNLVHGAPLGQDAVDRLKRAVNFPIESFYLPSEVSDFFSVKILERVDQAKKWSADFNKWLEINIEARGIYQGQRSLPQEGIEKEIWEIELDHNQPGRNLSQDVLSALVKRIPFLCGGSADLSSSDKTLLKEYSVVSKENLS
uniref:1-deoxy-D-xylulose-5-phosphate synthase N-terminal domain-containing protein n=1 Tax=Candidatus Similichlamydia epinepheli TaxID=1903953 RepID=UPI0023D8278D